MVIIKIRYNNIHLINPIIFDIIINHIVRNKKCYVQKLRKEHLISSKNEITKFKYVNTYLHN